MSYVHDSLQLELSLMQGLPTWTILGGGYQSYLKGDYQAAFDEWQPLAELGDAEAQYNLGVMFDQGASVEQDLAQAASWYRKAAEQGFVDAQTNLGMMWRALDERWRSELVRQGRRALDEGQPRRIRSPVLVDVAMR